MMLFSKKIVTIGILLASALAEPSDAEYQTFADMANEVYYAPRNNIQQQRSGKRGRHDIGAFKLTTRDCPSDEHHAVFVNDGTKEVVLAIRGVDDTEKMAIGMQLMFGATIEQLPRTKAALLALDEARNLARNKGYALKLTGHSLGGTLAMLMAAEENGNGIAAAFTFNASALSEEWFFTQAQAPVYASFWRGDGLSSAVLNSLEDAETSVSQTSVRVFETRIGNPHDLSNFCSQKVKAEELRIKQEEQAAQEAAAAAAAQAHAQRQHSSSPQNFRGQDLQKLMASPEAQQMMSALMGGMGGMRRDQNVPQHIPQWGPAY